MTDNNLPVITVEGDANITLDELEAVGILNIGDISKFKLTVSGTETHYEIEFGIGSGRADVVLDENNKPVSVETTAVRAVKRGGYLLLGKI